jgi:hypothetical protein
MAFSSILQAQIAVLFSADLADQSHQSVLKMRKQLTDAKFCVKTRKIVLLEFIICLNKPNRDSW